MSSEIKRLFEILSDISGMNIEPLIIKKNEEIMLMLSSLSSVKDDKTIHRAKKMIQESLWDFLSIIHNEEESLYDEVFLKVNFYLFE